MGFPRLAKTLTDHFSELRCPPVHPEGLRAPQTILELASELASASDRYRASMDAREDFRVVLRHAGSLARAADALTTAIADAVACGDNSLS